MRDIFYENKVGKLHFFGGDRQHKETRLILKEITGLGLPAKEYNVTGFSGQAGQELVTEKDVARVISMSCDLCCIGNLQYALRNLMKTLYVPGVLTIVSGNMRRKIACRCTKVGEPEYRGKHIATIVLQFTCDIPYFTGMKTEQDTLFSREDLISGSFTLPCVFTERITRKIVVNHGDVKAEPVFAICNVTNGSGVTSVSEDYGIYIVNHTTGQSILLLYRTSPGETITVDIPNRKIISDMAGDITYTISHDTFLSNFWLEQGENDLEAVNYNTSEVITMSIQYENQYIEAVI